MNLSAKASLYRELAKLVGAAFHLDRALEILLGQQPSHARRAWLLGLKQGLGGGLGVAEAVQSHNAAFSGPLEVTLISAGERSGRLADAFSHLARYFEVWELGLRQMRAALVYPLVLAHLGIILPEIPALVTAEMNGTEDSPARRILIYVLVFWLLLVLVAMAWRWVSRRGTESAAVERWLWRLPLIGAVRRHWALARFAQVFHACLLAGMRMTECMRLSGEASHCGVLRQAAEDAARKIATGEMIGGAMADVHGFPLIFVHSVQTAEEAGTLDREMNSWAASEMIEAQDALQRATAWMPKVFYLLVVVYVVYRIFALVSGYFGEVSRLQEMI
ncbi:MAG: type II secretion system F family protein [Verrucomicrobiaceae bacterium]|nr:type II secretion system F family protein [Verrucomicrobiaceae bacterium]